MKDLLELDIQYWALTCGLFMLVIFAIILFKSIIQSLKKARYIEDTPTSKIRSAPQGYVELEGVAEAVPGMQIAAPLTYKPCCWYSYQIEELVTRRVGNRTESSWQLVMNGISPDLFLLDDGTGKCVIAPLGAEVKTAHLESWTASQLPEHLQGGYARSGRQSYRLREARIEVADTLYVLGHFETIRNLKSLHEPEDFQPLPQQPASRGNRLRNLFMPHNKDIEKANREWQEYQKAQQEAKDLPDYINVMRQNPATLQPYLLSNLSQRALARKYRWQAFWFGVIFLVVVSMFSSLWYSKFDFKLPTWSGLPYA